MVNGLTHYFGGVKMEILNEFRFQLKEIDGKILIYDSLNNEERELV